MKKGELVELLARFGDNETVWAQTGPDTVGNCKGVAIRGDGLKSINHVRQGGLYASDVTIVIGS